MKMVLLHIYISTEGSKVRFVSFGVFSVGLDVCPCKYGLYHCRIFTSSGERQWLSFVRACLFVFICSQELALVETRLQVIKSLAAQAAQVATGLKNKEQEAVNALRRTRSAREEFLQGEDNREGTPLCCC